MAARPWRRLFTAFLWLSTLGTVGFYLRMIWVTMRGLFISTRNDTHHIPLTSDTPPVTIIVPARNEERNIRRCVASLLGQTYSNYDVIVVDDGSTDATGRILSELQHGPGGEKLSVIHVDHLPSGWAGKPHALATGIAAARGEWVLFTDADTMHRPGALAFAIQEAQRHRADLVSLLTQQEFADVSGHIIMPVVMMGISAQYPPTQVANPENEAAIANGQFLLIRRAAYDAVGGYDSPAMRQSVVDDRDLAAAVKRSGGRVVLLDGRDHVSVLMYRSLPEAWRGWSKNAYAGSRGGPVLFALFALSLPFGTIVPFILALVGIFSRRRAIALAGIAQTASILAYRWLVDGQLHHSRLWGWTHPAGGAIMTGLLWRVAWRQLTGRGVEWSGRTYQVEQGVPEIHLQAQSTSSPKPEA